MRTALFCLAAICLAPEDSGAGGSSSGQPPIIPPPGAAGNASSPANLREKPPADYMERYRESVTKPAGPKFTVKRKIYDPETGETREVLHKDPHPLASDAVQQYQQHRWTLATRIGGAGVRTQTEDCDICGGNGAEHAKYFPEKNLDRNGQPLPARVVTQGELEKIVAAIPKPPVAGESTTVEV